MHSSLHSYRYIIGLHNYVVYHFNLAGSSGAGEGMVLEPLEGEEEEDEEEGEEEEEEEVAEEEEEGMAEEGEVEREDSEGDREDGTKDEQADNALGQGAGQYQGSISGGWSIIVRNFRARRGGGGS